MANVAMGGVALAQAYGAIDRIIYCLENNKEPSVNDMHMITLSLANAWSLGKGTYNYTQTTKAPSADVIIPARKGSNAPDITVTQAELAVWRDKSKSESQKYINDLIARNLNNQKYELPQGETIESLYPTAQLKNANRRKPEAASSTYPAFPEKEKLPDPLVPKTAEDIDIKDVPLRNGITSGLKESTGNLSYDAETNVLSGTGADGKSLYHINIGDHYFSGPDKQDLIKFRDIDVPQYRKTKAEQLNQEANLEYLKASKAADQRYNKALGT